MTKFIFAYLDADMQIINIDAIIRIIITIHETHTNSRARKVFEIFTQSGHVICTHIGIPYIGNFSADETNPLISFVHTLGPRHRNDG